MYSIIKNKFQINQISSEKAANIKSQYASGKFEYFCSQLPYQFHKNPHHHIAINACVVCHHVLSLSSSSFSLSVVKKYSKRLVI
jgi:YHS domain-containing protein